MSTSPPQSCTESASYFSEKCSQCRFSCLKGTNGSLQKQAENGNGLSVIGTAAVSVGAIASLTGYSSTAAGLTIIGAVAIIAKLVSK
jgi:hypothetical protein